MKTLRLPDSSLGVVLACVLVQAGALYVVAGHSQRSLWLCVPAFFLSGFLADLVSGLFHFGFDYVWAARTPIFGPIAMEFREHHATPTLDPSAFVPNLTKGAWGATLFAVVAGILAGTWTGSPLSFFWAATVMCFSLWMLGFHQIHSYTHMGSNLSPEEFNAAVVEISKLPAQKQQREFAKLFDDAGIPRWVRLLQRLRLFLRPEVHWKHHISFKSDFSSVNGWSDPLMNPIYHWLLSRRAGSLAANSSRPTAS